MRNKSCGVHVDTVIRDAMQVFSSRTICRTHQARATMAVRCKLEKIRFIPCSWPLLSQRTATRTSRLTVKSRSCTYLRHCEDRLDHVNKRPPGRPRSRSKSGYNFATRSNGEATPKILAQVHHLYTFQIQRRHRAMSSARNVEQGARWKSKLPWFLSLLFAVGAVLGPALDGIHGIVHLLTYDSGQFDMAGVQSSGWVSLLLGTFYAVIGALHILGDHWQDTEASHSGQTVYRKQTVAYVMASIGYGLQVIEAKLHAMQQCCNTILMMCVHHSTVALLLYTSAVLYANNVDYTQVLSCCCHFALWSTCCAPFNPCDSCHYQAIETFCCSET